MKRMEGKVALVTGAAQGLGQAQAELLAAEGASVVVADLNAAQARRIAEGIRAAGGRAVGIELDVSSAEAWPAAIDQAISAYGGLHALINNAGIDLRGTVEDISLQQFHAVLDVNLLGTFLGTKYAIAHMKGHGGGSIVNIASTTAIVGAPVTTAYGASKAGVVNLSKTAALHCAQAGYGIRVNAVLPGLLRRAW